MEIPDLPFDMEEGAETILANSIGTHFVARARAQQVEVASIHEFVSTNHSRFEDDGAPPRPVIPDPLPRSEILKEKISKFDKFQAKFNRLDVNNPNDMPALQVLQKKLLQLVRAGRVVQPPSLPPSRNGHSSYIF